ncbi:hypothetical protein D3C71_21210 [compost metagenome]
MWAEGPGPTEGHLKEATVKSLKNINPLLHLALLMLGLFVLLRLAGMNISTALAATAFGLVLSLVVGYVRWRAQLKRERSWLTQAESALTELEKALAGQPPGSPRYTSLAESLERCQKELASARQRLYRRQSYLPNFLQA